MPGRIQLEILTKDDCPLCDTAKATVNEVLPDYPADLTLTDITTDSALFEAYREKIPVLRINGEDAFVHKVHPVTLRKKLDLLVKECEERIRQD